MKIINRIPLLILVTFAVASCSPGASAPTITTNALLEPTHTVVPKDTNIPVPSSTPTLSPIEKIFTLPTRGPFLDTTPTPIATPSTELSSLKLRELSEEELLTLISAMNEYSYQNYPPVSSWWTEGQFISSQEPVALSIQEYLYRFPESPNADRLRWQLAFINSIMHGGIAGNRYGDQWMLDQLQQNLNQGRTLPDRLENILEKYWFDVMYVQPVDNLFRDHRTAWIYQIAPTVWDERRTSENQSFPQGSMFFVVREHIDNEYKIYLLNSAWGLSFGVSYVFDITDHNKNDHPEIALYIGSHSGTMCGGELLIYEWKNETFVELTKGDLEIRDCIEEFEYTQTNEDPAIIYTGVWPNRKEQYIWNGDSYEFDRYINATALQVWQNSVGKPHFSYFEEAKLLNEIIASGKATNLGSAYPDFLRFRLGVVYALQSKQSEAINEFQDLVVAPSDTTRKIFPAMASRFLELYDGDSSVYSACHSSHNVYETALDPYRDSNNYIDDQKHQEILGLSFESYFSFGFLLCDEKDAFILMVNSISSSTEDISAALRNNGVDLNFLQNLDANLDGKIEERIIVFDTYNSFLVIPDGSYFRASELDVSIGAEGTDYSSIYVTVETWNNFKNPILVIRSDGDFSLLEIDEDYTSKSLFYSFDVMKHTISDQDAVPQFQLFYSKPKTASYYPDYPWDGYRWDLKQNTFNSDLLEYKLFISHDSKESLEIVEQLLPLLDEWKNIPGISGWSLPYTYYLSGLSYELSGNAKKAAQVYSQLWSDFPDSRYALLARYKLEPIIP